MKGISGRFSTLKAKNEDPASPKSADVLGERYIILAEAGDIYTISLATRTYMFAIAVLWDAISVFHCIYLLAPYASDLIDEIDMCTDHSAFLWTNDYFLMELLVDCHSAKWTNCAWNFGHANDRVYDYDIKDLWNSNQSPKWTNVITYSCYTDYYSTMRNAWIDAKSYGAKYDGTLFAGSKVVMHNYLYTPIGMGAYDLLLSLVIPLTTHDLWWIAIFWEYDFILGVSFMPPIILGCAVYDIQMATQNPSASLLYLTNNYMYHTPYDLRNLDPFFLFF